MQISEVSAQAGQLQLSISGQLNANSASQLCDRLLKMQPKQIALTLDLAELSDVDSAGVATLVEALRRSRERGGELTLLRPSPAITNALSLAKLEGLFTIRAEAV